VRQGLGNLDRPLVAAQRLPRGIDRARFSAAEGYLLLHADGSASARSMIATSPLPSRTWSAACWGSSARASSITCPADRRSRSEILIAPARRR